MYTLKVKFVKFAPVVQEQLYYYFSPSKVHSFFTTFVDYYLAKANYVK